MTLFNVVVKNIKRNFYNYFLYFVSMIFSISIYFIFNSIEYNKQVALMIKGSKSIAIAFQTSAVVVAIISAIFIWYSNSFFISKRKKEVGLYSLLGIKKKNIGRMLFYENIIIGAFALIAGMIIGGLLSKLFTMLLIKAMGFSIAIKFAIEPKAIINTLIVFGVIFIIASLHSYRIIYRFKLIELFNAEKTRDKEPKASLILSIVSIALIGIGYYTYIKYMTILETLLLVVVGTYLLFNSLVLFIVKSSRWNRSHYYKGLNMIKTSQLLYRIKSNAVSLATIAVLSATTLTAMGVVSSIYYNFVSNINEDYPFTIAAANISSAAESKIDNIMAKYPKNKILIKKDINLINGISADIPGVGKTNFSSSHGNYLMLPQSEYNNIIKITKSKNKPVQNDSANVYIIDTGYNDAMYNSYKGKNLIINSNGKKSKYNIMGFSTIPLVNNNIAGKIIIVNDSIYKNYYDPKSIYKVSCYINDNKNNSKEMTEAVSNIVKANISNDKLYLNYSNYYDNYIDQLQFTGLTMFIGVFLSLLFLISTGSIIFFKQLSEANYDKPNFVILKKIGVNKKEVNRVISKQILTVFSLPLIVGVVHSLVANSLVGKIYNTDFTIPVLVSIAAYTFIYMIYYFLTVKYYNRIVNS